MWFRVFSLSKDPLVAEELEEQLLQLTPQWRWAFEGDEQGWFYVALFTSAWEEAGAIEHYWATEDGIRPQLNAWAAWLEIQETKPNSVPLMQRVIQTGQLFCLNAPAAPAQDDTCWRLCRWLAQRTDGVFQADGSGFHAADGTLLVAETA